MTQWVVTYKIELPNDDIMFAEFFRGGHEECVRIREFSGVGDHDTMKTKRPWKPIVGLAKEWDEFLRG
jgi:hypothetical protein